jgi:hypothetical protein
MGQQSFTNIFLLMANLVTDPDTGAVQEYGQLIVNLKAGEVAKKFGRLTQGIKTPVKGTSIINFIPHLQVSSG